MSRTTISLVSIVPFIVLLMVAAGLLAPKPTSHPIIVSPYHHLRVGSTTLNVEIAATPEARRQGLSGHQPLKDNEGMLFVFDAPAPQAFWMKDMLFPLDMIWIGANKNVLGITTNVPTPLPGTSSDKLPLYSSPGPAAYVLEVNAGWAAKHKVMVGDHVEF